jgi:hypothetical protein
MAALSPERIGVVRSLIASTPDKALRELDAAFKGEAAGGALSVVREIVDSEVWDRTVRDVVFGPLEPLCRRREDGFAQVEFPAAVLGRLWRALKIAEPKLVAVTSSSLTITAQDQAGPPTCDDLCRAAAVGLRAAHPDFAAAAALLEAHRPGAGAEFAAYLDLAPIGRQALLRLPDWLSRMTEERATLARLTFNDAVDLAEDSGPKLIEMLFSHLSEPWTVLRVMSAVMNRAGDRYASSSELAMFGDRIMDDIDRRLEQLRAFDLDGGAAAGAAAATAVRIAANEAAEFEQWLDIDREGPWGRRLSQQKGLLAKLAEGLLKKCDRTVGEALPLQPVRIGGRVIRGEPKLATPPDARLVRRAQAIMTFFEQVRIASVVGGYGVTRGKVGEEVTHRLDTYLEELLAAMHAGETEHLDAARAYLEIVAEFMGLAQDEKAAQIVRRRAAAA